MSNLAEKIEACGFGNRAFVPQGKLIMEAGNPTENLVFLLEGSALAFTDNVNGSITIYDKLRPGSIFGFETLSSLENHPYFENKYIYSLKPITPCRILRYSVFETDQIMARLELSKEVFKAYNDFNRRMQQKIIDVQTKTAEERLAGMLLDFADRDQQSGKLVLKGMSQMEIGGAIFVSRERTNNLLGNLIEADFLTSERGQKYTVLNEAGLKMIADRHLYSSDSLPAYSFL